MISLSPTAISGPALHGESPLWCPTERVLYWIDIQNALLHWLAIKSGEPGQWKLPRRICAVALAQDGKLIAALEDGICVLNPATRTIQSVAKPDLPPHVRFNDGKCDRIGRFFAGTMHENEQQPLGALFCISSTYQLTNVRSNLIIANGPAFSPDGATMYLVDSARRRIFAIEYDSTNGSLGHETIFAATDDLPGKPDGITVDREGFLWCAYWGGGQVVRHASDGSVDRVIELPVSQPSSCTFGSVDLKTMFITSAAKGLNPSELAREPLAGCVFAIELHTPGIPEAIFGMHS
jgi:sugar lactone lactonase YvrE